MKKQVKQDRETWISQECKELEIHAKKNLRNLSAKVKKLTNEQATKHKAIKDKNGKILTTNEQIKDRWYEYGSELNKEPTSKDVL